MTARLLACLFCALLMCVLRATAPPRGVRLQARGPASLKAKSNDSRLKPLLHNRRRRYRHGPDY